MKRCNIVLNDGSYINVAADWMTKEDDMLYIWDEKDLVAVVEITAVISAHISEKGDYHGSAKD